jgi:mRNA interferase RelE/StbE
MGPPKGPPFAVSVAVLELVSGPLLDNPRRLGKPLGPPFEGCHIARCADYGVRYVIVERTRTVYVVDVSHRADAYRSGD